MPLLLNAPNFLNQVSSRKMQRLPEQELMDDAAQCQAYASADFAASNQLYVEIVRELIPANAAVVLDVGCGPSDVLIRLAQRCPSLKITGVDASPTMIQLATKAIEDSGLSRTIEVFQGYVPGLKFATGHFDAILSKDFLHHLPNPMVIWHEIRRLIKPGGFVCVMDLRRPESTEAAQQIVKDVAGNEPDILKTDFYNSLLAAFTPEEIQKQLKVAGMELEVAAFGSRHMLIQGIAPQTGHGS
jgi:ubiquinone/menaquinone biosynthesis C-methylase UbiE